MLLLSATAVALWPRTYGTAATFVLDGGAQVINPVALAGRIEAALLERDGLATVAMELPPELRSPDPIGRLRAGIRVQSQGVLGFTVEFRGSDPQSVQRIANRLAERAVAVVPRLSTSSEDAAPALALAARTRAVTEFLTAHPEMTLEQTSGKAGGSGGSAGAAADSGLELLRTEKRQIEQRLATGATDNPYAEPGQDPSILNLRLAELKTTIQRRETALKQPHAASPPTVAPELTSQWRALLADLATAQASASVPGSHPTVVAHITARASLPSSPLTPNRLVLSMVAALLSMAAAMIAYVLPRKAEPTRRTQRSGAPAASSEPPPAQRAAAGELAPNRNEPPPPAVGEAPPAQQRSEPPPKRSDPHPPGRPGSEPPGPIAVQRTVVLGPSPAAASSNAQPPTVTATRRHTSPGGMAAPSEAPSPFADTSLAPPTTTHSPPAAPLFGSRPPPGAGSYSVSSSRPPPIGPADGVKRTSVERLSPLQSQRPPSQPTPSRSPPPLAMPDQPQIVSRPPALDPEAETWAARFETVPPPAPTPEDAEAAPRKRSGRWKTQVMGSMVPIEVSAAREERPPVSEPDSFRPEPNPVAVPAAVPPLQPAQGASGVTPHDVPFGWRPNVQLEIPEAIALRDAVLKQASSRRLSVVVTGASRQNRTQMACALAFALAQSGARVLLVEADFDRPELHQALAINAPPGAGFSQQLMGRHHDQQPRPWAVVRCTPNLNALVEGRLRSPGLLASHEFERALQELRDQHHVLIVHAPLADRRTELWTLGGITQAVVVTNDGQPTTIQFGDGALRAMLG